jgi:hypothetical protein
MGSDSERFIRYLFTESESNSSFYIGELQVEDHGKQVEQTFDLPKQLNIDADHDLALHLEAKRAKFMKAQNATHKNIKNRLQNDIRKKAKKRRMEKLSRRRNRG